MRVMARRKVRVFPACAEISFSYAWRAPCLASKSPADAAAFAASSLAHRETAIPSWETNCFVREQRPSKLKNNAPGSPCKDDRVTPGSALTFSLAAPNFISVPTMARNRPSGLDLSLSKSRISSKVTRPSPFASNRAKASGMVFPDSTKSRTCKGAEESRLSRSATQSWRRYHHH